MTDGWFFARRVVAVLIDWILVSWFASAAAGLARHVPVWLAPDAGPAWGRRLSLLTAIATQALLLASFERSGWQATFGKRLVGLRVAMRDGGRPGWRAAVTRNLVQVFSLLALTLASPGFLFVGSVALGMQYALVAGMIALIVFSIPGTNIQRRAIHDFVAGTRVVAKADAASG